MKKILLSVLMLFMVSAFMYGQQEVTKFLGIPVDGFKPEMIKKLKEKGFVASSIDEDVLEGEFNGKQVNIRVVTNNNKVYRIYLADANNVGETDIKIRFNSLCRQFENNDNYFGLSGQTIDDDEDISYQIAVNDKRYEAIFYQKGEGSMFDRPVWFMIGEISGRYYIAMFYDNELNRARGEDL